MIYKSIIKKIKFIHGKNKSQVPYNFCGCLLFKETTKVAILIIKSKFDFILKFSHLWSIF